MLFSSTGACTVYVSRAEDAYTDGRYLEVAEDLARHEPSLPKLTPIQKARYGLYRGLSLLKLGEVDDAQRWLDYAQQLEAQIRKLDVRQRKQLQLGLAALQQFRVAPNSAPSAQSPPNSGLREPNEQLLKQTPSVEQPEKRPLPQTH